MHSSLLTLPLDPIRSWKLKLVWALEGFIEIRYVLHMKRAGMVEKKIESLSNLRFPVIIRDLCPRSAFPTAFSWCF